MLPERRAAVVTGVVRLPHPPPLGAGCRVRPAVKERDIVEDGGPRDGVERHRLKRRAQVVPDLADHLLLLTTNLAYA